MQLVLNSPNQTDDLAHELSLFAHTGMCICLYGDLGAGKSHFARKFIRSLSGDETLEVPSPTFALIQNYDTPHAELIHCDFYRLQDPQDALETGFAEDLDSKICLIEWPQNAADILPNDRIELHFTIEGTGRTVEILGHGSATTTVERMQLVRQFLDHNGWRGAKRHFLQADASARRYESMIGPTGQPALLMDMPTRPDGPPVKDGLPYSQIAHIAENIIPVAAINHGLLEAGFSAPQIWALDAPNGFAIVEHLGDQVFGSMTKQGEDMTLPMQTATEALAAMARHQWPERVDLPHSISHEIPAFDTNAMSIEISLLLDWYWPHLLKTAAPSNAGEEFYTAWNALWPYVATENPVWLMRDFHSPNIIWLPQRDGIKRIGLIDTQDCVFGHPAYDLVSFLQDARLDVPQQTEVELLDHYCATRQAAENNFDADAFRLAYAVMGAQRATKILGIFARLAHRDGKPSYLAHIPRVSNNLERNLRHPALQPLKAWYDRYLPVATRQ